MVTDPTITHTAPSGRAYRLISIEQLTTPASKWIEAKKAFCSHWRTLIQFHDDMSRVWLYYDYEDKFYKLENF